MTAKQFYSEEGQKLMQLEYDHKKLLDKSGYTTAAARRMERIMLLRKKVERLYPDTTKPEILQD